MTALIAICQACTNTTVCLSYE